MNKHSQIEYLKEGDDTSPTCLTSVHVLFFVDGWFPVEIVE